MQLSFFRADDIRPSVGAVRIRPKRYDRPVHAARAIHESPLQQERPRRVCPTGQIK